MSKPARQLQSIALNQIKPGNNDRQHFDHDALVELAESIHEQGLIEPVALWHRPNSDGEPYQIMAGERRWRAHLLIDRYVGDGDWPVSDRVIAGHIEAIVYEGVSAEEADDIMLIENDQREDLSVMERARAYQKRIDAHGYSVAEMARRYGKSPAYISTALTMLKLCPEAQKLLDKGNLQLQFAQKLTELNHDFQRNVINWLAKQTYVPTMPYFSKFVEGQKLKQGEQSLFDMRDVLCATAVEVAENPDIRVSDTLPAIDELPPLPVTRGKPGKIIDAYITSLLAAEEYAAAAVIIDLWRKLMKCNKLQVPPWESTVLPTLERCRDDVVAAARTIPAEPAPA